MELHQIKMEKMPGRLSEGLPRLAKGLKREADKLRKVGQHGSARKLSHYSDWLDSLL